MIAFTMPTIVAKGTLGVVVGCGKTTINQKCLVSDGAKANPMYARMAF